MKTRLLLACFVLGAARLAAQSVEFTALAWRNLGPMRGGRSIANGASSARPNEFYFGATGGGLWKTTDAGNTWAPVTDGQINSSSVGAIAVSPSNPDILYIGMGECQLRGNVMQGDGLYKSTDAGKTWHHLGLAETRTVSRLRIHPTNPDIVYAAVLGDPTQPTVDRGVYRTTDGGRTWKKILYRDERSGAIDLTLDPNHPDTLYAALWETYRVPWRLWSGGPGSGLYKSTDGGETWTGLTRNPGFPAGTIGKIGITVSGADSSRLYAIVEAKNGGLYRSDDAGAHWQLANNHRDLWQRSFYFDRLVADPTDRDRVYILNFRFSVSNDGGKTYRVIPTHHGDTHDLWIDPQDHQRMILSDDGGAEISVNGGATWSNQLYSTAQPYRVETTADFPYHVAGCQQDNSSVVVPSLDPDGTMQPAFPMGPDRGALGYFYYSVGGGESGWVAPHPAKPDLFFAGSTNTLTRVDRRTGETRDVQPWPRIVMGESSAEIPERWNWTYPVIFSPLPPYDLYCGSQHVWRSTDEGRTWEKISPDLTLADPATLGPSGGPLMLDQDGPEVYGTVFALAPSRTERHTVWAGSDDGLVHVTRDGGKSWKKITPPGLPVQTRISVIEPSPHAPGTAYVAAKRNQLGDRQPYLYKTADYGATWTRLDAPLPREEFTHVIREDPTRRGLLYLGTERGVWISWDDGAHWSSLRLNLPVTQVSDLKVEKNDLVIATHGRGFWVMDNIAPLRQAAPDLAKQPVHLFTPAGVYREAYPAKIDFLLAAETKGAQLEILDASGQLVRQVELADPLAPGHHRVEWNLRTRGATVFPGMIIEAPSPANGVLVPPGDYQARLTAAGQTQTVKFTVQPDPRMKDVTPADYAAQFALAVTVRDATSAANEAVIQIRTLKQTLQPGNPLIEKLTAVEGELYQIKNQSPKDKIANAIKLNDRLAGLLSLVGEGTGAPTAAEQQVARQLTDELNVLLARLKTLL
jgi:photosystem II stability/assembly factor-like uncharacterized protein